MQQGIASIFIGLMMFFVVGRVFLDNADGALGEADNEMEVKIAQFLQMRKFMISKHYWLIKEGEEFSC